MDWQTPLTLVIVLIAVSDVVRRLWVNLSGRSKPGCGSGCSGCGSQPASEPTVVQLGTNSVLPQLAAPPPRVAKFPPPRE